MNALPCGPVAWSDGLFIEVQHFQQLERHLGHQLAARLGFTSNHAWGFAALEVDDTALGLGRLALRSAGGVFPDGTPFSLPIYDPLPEPLAVDGAQPGDIACIALKAARSGGAEMAFGQAGPATRYRAMSTEVPDVNAGLDAAGSPRTVVIDTGRLATRLCWQAQIRPDEVALPFARVGARISQQGVALDRAFIAPLLDARASDTLRMLIDELRTLMQARLSAYTPMRTLPAAGGLADLATLLLRQAMTEYRIRLAHLDAFNPLPPAMLHHELIGLLGRLSVLPGVDEMIGSQAFSYRHDDLQQSFGPLTHALRDALARIIETPVVPLRFEPRGDAIHVCQVDPQWQLDMLVFAFSAAMPAERLRQTLPPQVKLGPVEQIQKLVDLQLPGARLVPLPTPPRQIPYYAQSVYFGVESVDPFLQATLSGAAIALRIVGDFPELRFDAWGLRKEKVA